MYCVCGCSISCKHGFGSSSGVFDFWCFVWEETLVEELVWGRDAPSSCRLPCLSSASLMDPRITLGPKLMLMLFVWCCLKIAGICIHKLDHSRRCRPTLLPPWWGNWRGRVHKDSLCTNIVDDLEYHKKCALVATIQPLKRRCVTNPHTVINLRCRVTNSKSILALMSRRVRRRRSQWKNT